MLGGPVTRRFQVPASFVLGGTVWTVEHTEGFENLGQCYRDEALIRLRAGMPTQIAESTFLHELVHAILYSMGVDAEHHDERNIDAASTFLHQFLLTRKH